MARRKASVPRRSSKTASSEPSSSELSVSEQASNRTPTDRLPRPVGTSGRDAKPSRPDCLSAFGRIGTAGQRRPRPVPDPVSIAFRLSDELGPARSPTRSTPRRASLNCLSAFGRIGTIENWNKFSNASSSLNCLSAFGRIGTRAAPPSSSSRATSLNCLSAFGRIGTREGSQRVLPRRSGLNCLSAFGRIGTRLRRSIRRPAFARVSIAFRLSDELGLRMSTSDGTSPPDVSIAFRLSDELGHPQDRYQAVNHLKSQLPFGFRTNWDPFEYTDFEVEDKWCLNCLSAFGRIGTRQQSCRHRQQSPRRLNCLSAFGRIGTRIRSSPSQTWANVSIAFRLSDELGPANCCIHSLVFMVRVSIAFRLSDELGPQNSVCPADKAGQHVSIAFRLSDELGLYSISRPISSGFRRRFCISGVSRVFSVPRNRPEIGMPSVIIIASQQGIVCFA